MNHFFLHRIKHIDNKQLALASQQIEAISQGSPRPRKTLTALLPLMLPTELSAVFSLMAANLLANVSGILVPRATKVMATTVFSRPTRHPKMLARSDIRAVIKPINISDPINVRQPPAMDGGGMKANKTCKFEI